MSNLAYALLAALVLTTSCGVGLPQDQGTDSPPPTDHGAQPASGPSTAPSQGATPSNGASSTPSPSADATASDGTAPAPTAPSVGNRAEWLCRRVELADTQVKDLDDKQGKAVLTWLAAAMKTAGSSQPVTFGTIFENADGTHTYTAAPTDGLVIQKSSGYVGKLTSIVVRGDVTNQYFPSDSADSLSVRWSAVGQDLVINRSRSSTSYQGYYTDSDGRRRDVSLQESGNACGADRVTTGTIQVDGESYTVNAKIHGCAGPSAWSITHVFDTQIAANGSTWRVNGEFANGTWGLGYVPNVDWTGTISHDGVSAGSLQMNVLLVTAAGDNIDLDYVVGSDRYTWKRWVAFPY